MSHVLLIGFMGAGKSTVGRLLAERLELPFIDLDAEIERAAGDIPVSEIFAIQGEPAFREIESAVLRSMGDVSPAVVACGGGVVLDDDNRTVLHSLGRVVYLKVDASEAIARIGDAEGRPLLQRGDATEMATTLLAARESLYRSTADLVVDTAGLPAADVADRVLEEISLPEAGGTGRTGGQADG